MSELKVYTQDEILDSSIGDDVYLQPDVDKILAEKDKKIAELDDKLRNYPMMAALIEGDNKKIRRLKRALYKACANWANLEVFDRTVGIDDPNVEANRWALMRNKCLKKAEEYK